MRDGGEIEGNNSQGSGRAKGFPHLLLFTARRLVLLISLR